MPELTENESFLDKYLYYGVGGVACVIIIVGSIIIHKKWKKR